MDLSAEDILERDFRSRRRGYDSDEVDEFLELVARHVHELEEEVEESRRLLERPIELGGHQLASIFNRAQEITDDLMEQARTSRDHAQKEADELAAKILGEARSEAEALRSRAREETTSQREDAEAYASQLRAEVEKERSEADRYAQQVRSDAEEEAERIRSEVRKEAETVRSDAEERALHLREQAETRAQEIMSEADEKARAETEDAERRVEQLRASERHLIDNLKSAEEALRSAAGWGGDAPADPTNSSPNDGSDLRSG